MQAITCPTVTVNIQHTVFFSLGWSSNNSEMDPDRWSTRLKQQDVVGDYGCVIFYSFVEAKGYSVIFAHQIKHHHRPWPHVLTAMVTGTSFRVFRGFSGTDCEMATSVIKCSELTSPHRDRLWLGPSVSSCSTQQPVWTKKITSS